MQSGYAFQRGRCYFNDLLKLTVVAKSNPENIIWMFTNNGYFNKDQIEKNRQEISILEGDHGQIELLFIIVWTRQQHSAQYQSRECNNLSD